MPIMRTVLLSATFFSFVSQASAAMWIYPEMDAVSCDNPAFIFNDEASIDTEPVNITPLFVYDNKIRSGTLGFVCGEKERKYRVSDLREPCEYGWKARIERLPVDSGDSASGLNSHELCVGMDGLLVNIAVYVTKSRVTFASVGPNNEQVYVDSESIE